ncbi:MAG: divergent PAP2 family protein [Candidatus Woesearchaeota archaeon]
MELFIVWGTITAWLFSEVLKVIFASYRCGKLDFKACIRYGGMPSSHSAFVSSLAVSVYVVQGLSALFIVCVALAVLVVRDIMVIRGTIDSLISELKLTKKIRLITHTPVEIGVGLGIGIIVPLLLLLFF